MSQIIDCAHSIGAPVVTTFKAKGQISDTHPLGCGVLGRSGTPIASWFMNESDLLITYGASFSNHTGIADYKPTIQVDFDPMALGRFHSVDIPVLGDVGVTAQLIQERMPAKHMFKDRTKEVAERWAIWRAEKASRRTDDSGQGINSAAIFDSLSRMIDPDAALAVDVGNKHLLFRSLLRGPEPVLGDVGLSRVYRVRVSCVDGSLGGGGRRTSGRCHRG